jgi:hypothetical protein
MQPLPPRLILARLNAKAKALTAERRLCSVKSRQRDGFVSWEPQSTILELRRSAGATSRREGFLSHRTYTQAYAWLLPPGFSGGAHSYACAAPRTLRNKIHKFLQPELLEAH